MSRIPDISDRDQLPEGQRRHWDEIMASRGSADAVFAEAATPGRRSEALFVLGALAANAGDRSVAATRWKEVLALGRPDLIEYAAARNELARL